MLYLKHKENPAFYNHYIIYLLLNNQKWKWGHSNWKIVSRSLKEMTSLNSFLSIRPAATTCISKSSAKLFTNFSGMEDHFPNCANFASRTTNDWTKPFQKPFPCISITYFDTKYLKAKKSPDLPPQPSQTGGLFLCSRILCNLTAMENEPRILIFKFFSK